MDKEKSQSRDTEDKHHKEEEQHEDSAYLVSQGGTEEQLAL
jgi:hypothetical protein